MPQQSVDRIGAGRRKTAAIFVWEIRRFPGWFCLFLRTAFAAECIIKKKGTETRDIGAFIKRQKPDYSNMSFGKIFRQGKTGNGKGGNKKAQCAAGEGERDMNAKNKAKGKNWTGTKPRAGKLFWKIKKHSIDCAFHFADD